jgi:putative endonuclease
LSTAALGQAGEDRACQYLLSQEYRIIERNYRSPLGEIDIIAWKAGIIVFCEVKSWGAYSISELEYSVNAKKRFRIIETSKMFLNRHRQYNGDAIRYDLLFVPAGDAEIQHFESAFTE